jgi:hypothetical protein
VVSAGDRLVTRVRVASGLTPPPGIQQEAALRGWSAELVGQSVALGAPTEHRYPVRVIDVRPDGQSSLVYRATVLVPAWAAPGTYGLRMTAPGGETSAAGAVRVLARDAPVPRIALLSSEVVESVQPGEGARAFLEALATMPVDVVVTEAAPSIAEVIGAAPLDAPLPAWVALPRGGMPVVLRVGEDALVLGECDDRLLPFDEQLAGLVAHEARRPHPFSVADLPSEGARLRGGPRDRELAIAAPSTLTLTREDGALSFASPSARELTVVFPADGRGVALDGGAMSLFPAAAVPTIGTGPSIAARLSIPANETATLTRPGETRALRVRVEVHPEKAKTRELVRLHALVEGEAALVAWRLGEDATFVGDHIEERFGALGDHEAHVVVLGMDGAMAEASARFSVETREVRGCGGSSCAVAAPRAAPPLELWLLGVLLLQRVSSRGNRPRRQSR